MDEQRDEVLSNLVNMLACNSHSLGILRIRDDPEHVLHDLENDLGNEPWDGGDGSQYEAGCDTYSCVGGRRGRVDGNNGSHGVSGCGDRDPSLRGGLCTHLHLQHLDNFLDNHLESGEHVFQEEERFLDKEEDNLDSGVGPDYNWTKAHCWDDKHPPDLHKIRLWVR